MGTYRKIFSKEFLATDFKDPQDVPRLMRAPWRCEKYGHTPDCLTADDAWNTLACMGLWKLRSPIIINEMMPGQSQKVLTVSVLGQVETAWLFTGYAFSHIILAADGGEIFRYENLSHDPAPKWAENPINVNKSIDTYSDLDVRLFQRAQAYTGWTRIHDAHIKIDCEYYTDIPPPLCDVRIEVLNAETALPIDRARVRIKAGAIVIRDDYTNVGGIVEFHNVEEGSYSLRVTKSGFESLERSIEVLPPIVEYEAKLVPIPAPPPPWWLWPLIGGVAVLGAITIIPPLLKKREEKPPIIVVK